MAAPCRKTERSTTRQVISNKRTLPGMPANTGNRIKSNELRPRGPNQATSRRSLGPIPNFASTGSSTAVRTASARNANRIVRASATFNPVQMSHAPNATKVNRRNISEVA
jgi:hypothetical protein